MTVGGREGGKGEGEEEEDEGKVVIPLSCRPAMPREGKQVFAAPAPARPLAPSLPRSFHAVRLIAAKSTRGPFHCRENCVAALPPRNCVLP